jgi:dehydrogenase/reductase SDR family protein 1
MQVINMNNKSLHEKVVQVTGGTRGIGKGIVIALARAGATVYFTGRTEIEYEGAVKLSGSLKGTENEVKENGDMAIGLKCDHTNDIEVKQVIDTINNKHGRIDILVNNVWGGDEHFNNGTKFWEEQEFWTKPLSRYDSMFNVGVRSTYVTSSLVAPIMIKQDAGLIVNISFWVAQRNDKGTIYCTAKAATDKLTATMAHDFGKHNVAVVSLYPGLVRTEAVLAGGEFFDLSNSESPEFIGRAIIALALDGQVMSKTGKVLVAATLATEYGFTDIDGTQPIALTSETC